MTLLPRIYFQNIRNPLSLNNVFSLAVQCTRGKNSVGERTRARGDEWMRDFSEGLKKRGCE